MEISACDIASNILKSHVVRIWISETEAWAGSSTVAAWLWPSQGVWPGITGCMACWPAWSKVMRDSLKCVVHGFCVSASTLSQRSSKSSNVSVVFSLSELVFQGPQWAAGTLTEELKERWQQVRITVRRLHATSQQWHHDYENGRQLMDVMMTSHAFCGVLRSLIL